MNIPSWVNDIQKKPRSISRALTYFGLKEIPGEKSNPKIIEMASLLGIGKIYLNDDTAWCSLFRNFICFETNEMIAGSGYDILRAKNFIHWGIDSGSPKFGDTLIFSRPEGFHVGYYIAESDPSSKDKVYFVFGGNESNMVNIVPIAKKRLVASRCENLLEKSNGMTKHYMDLSGKVSQNES